MEVRRIFAGLLLAAFISFQALADDAPKVPNMASDPAYFACAVDSDCAAANPPCGRLKAFNRQYRREVQEWYDYVRPKSECNQTFDQLRMAPVCEHNKCMMREMDEDHPSRDAPNYCEINEQCVVLTGRCGVKITVNRWHAAETQEKIGSAEAPGCGATDTREVTNLRCEKHQCKADVAAPTGETDVP
ncbi:MAG: hypothetical protein ACAH80_16500 [Alphaproteobacteria bacterium]